MKITPIKEVYPGRNTMVKVKQLSEPKTKIDVDICESRKIHEDFFKTLEFKHCEDTISLLTAILPTKFRGKTCTIDSGHILLKWVPNTPSSNDGLLTVKNGNQEQTLNIYQKKIPLIDPFQWLKYKETTVLPFSWKNQSDKVLDAENQAYIDILGSSLVSKINKIYNSPHFCKFYGCFRAVAEKYKYDLKDDLEDIRFTTWFWNAVENNEFVLNMVEKSTGKKLSLEEIKQNMKPDDEYLEDSDSESGSESGSGSESESGSGSEYESKLQSDFELKLEEIINIKNIDLEEVTFDDKNDESSEPILLNKKRGLTQDSVSTDSSSYSIYDDYDIFIELSQMPIAVMYIEKCEGTLDEILESEITPIKTLDDEKKWCAWLFQIIAALCQVQDALRLTHNDLHTNNILWKKTNDEFLYYKDSLGLSYKIPTYGYIFTIIDYGRAIFSINNFYCISSDYQDGNNAAGQYNFGPIEDEDEKRVYPNKSFDLSRLSCSLIRGLFPYNPATKVNGKIITKDHGFEIRETNHELFNLLWLWLKSDNGENILEKYDGSEKFPGFDLYIEIAHHVKEAVPRVQLSHPAMKCFLVNDIPKDCKPIIIP